MKNKTILIIYHGQGVGGGLIALLGLIDELKINFNVKVFSIFESVANKYIENLGVEVITPKTSFYKCNYNLFIHSEASYWDLISLIRNIKNLITFMISKYIFAPRELEFISKDVDIVYLNSTFISDWSYGAKKINKKVVIHVREPLAKGFLGIRYQLIRNNIKKYCDKIICVSKDNFNRLNLIEKSIVIYDPVVIKNRSNDLLIEYKEGLKYFIYVGGELRIKGFEQFVKCLKYLNDDIRIYFLGQQIEKVNTGLKYYLRIILNPYNYRVNKLINTYKKSDKIIEIGMTNNVIKYYEKSLALISPFSKPHACLPILEAFSVGKPVIVSDIQGMDELVSNLNGDFFKNKDYKDLAYKINNFSCLDNAEIIKKNINAKLTYNKIRKSEISILEILKDL